MVGTTARFRRAATVCAAAALFTVGLATPSGAATRSVEAATGGATVHFAAGGRWAPAAAAPVPAARRSPFAGSITTTGTAYPPNALCLALHLGYPNFTTVQGFQFGPNKNGLLLQSDKSVGSFASDSGGSFQTIATALNEPAGTYTLTARQSPARIATTPMQQGATSCVSIGGIPGALQWQWQSAGLAANQPAEITIDGAGYQEVNTNAKGAFRVSFTKACPAAGSHSVVVSGFVDGASQELFNSTFDCGPAFAQIPQPDSSYVGNTCLIDMSSVPEGTDVSQLFGCGEALSFSQSDGIGIHKYSASDGYKWGQPPAVEPGTPDSLYAKGDTDLTVSFSTPVSVAGLEIQPDRFICSHHPPENVDVEFNDPGGNQIGDIDSLLPACSKNGGAALFAANTLPPGAKIGSIVISSSGASCCSTYYSMARFRIRI